jgi:hypothetical protein
MIFNKGEETIEWKKVSLVNRVLGKLYIYMQKNEVIP